MEKHSHSDFLRVVHLLGMWQSIIVNTWREIKYYYTIIKTRIQWYRKMHIGEDRGMMCWWWVNPMVSILYRDRKWSSNAAYTNRPIFRIMAVHCYYNFTRFPPHTHTLGHAHTPTHAHNLNYYMKSVSLQTRWMHLQFVLVMFWVIFWMVNDDCSNFFPKVFLNTTKLILIMPWLIKKNHE